MSDAEDKDGKTEEPTDNKIRTAIEKGNVPTSREVAILGSLTASLVGVVLLVNGPAASLSGTLAKLLDDAGTITLNNGGDAVNILGQVAFASLIVVAPLMLLLAAAGIGSSIIQNAPRLVGERVMPQLSRISIGGGAKRLFGIQGLVEFAKSTVKLGAVTLVGIWYLNSVKGQFLNAMFAEPVALLELLFHTVVMLLMVISGMSAVIVAVDWAWQRFSWRRNLRMSRQEVKDEMKQMDGDPLIKAKLKSLARDRARQRMMAAVPRATLVIANPTHYAVALRYVRSEGGAPMVLAKGRDIIALRIRAIAEENDIPVIEDKPLARALYAAAEVDRMIPAEFYRAVAKLILYLNARGGRMVTA